MVKLAIGKLKNIPSSLTSLKSKVDKFHIGKLENKPLDLSKLCNVIKNMMLLKRLNIIYLKKVNNICTTDILWQNISNNFWQIKIIILISFFYSLYFF